MESTAGVRRPKRPAVDDMSQLMAIIRVFAAAALLGIMLGHLPAQDSRLERVESRVSDQAERLARIEAKLETVLGYTQTGAYGFIGMVVAAAARWLASVRTQQDES